MQTRLSSKGQVVLPSKVRRRLGLREGEPLDVSIDGERVILTRTAPAISKARIATDPETGLPVLTVRGTSPKMTSEQVAELLAEFP
jgi:AbrB family looped-hinge helix DNA binding protein